MNFDTFEANALETGAVNIKNKLSELRKGFENSLESHNDAFMDVPECVDDNIIYWLEMDPAVVPDYTMLRASVMDTVKQLYNGVDLGDGNNTLGLQEICDWSRNDLLYDQSLCQHAGFAAEVIGTTKENLAAKLEGTGVTTYRADDLPELYQKNDQYVDKIRVNQNGEIIDRIQVKFVGKNAKECLSKMMSKKYDKYFEDGKINKMEVPKDFYDDMKQLIPKKIDELEKQLQSVKEQGKTEVAQRIEAKIERYKKVDQMLEKSTVTKAEAKYAVEHPKRYAAKLLAKDTFMDSHKKGLDSAAFAASLTAAVSTVDNVSKYMDGEITAQEAFVDVAKDTGTAAGMAYGTAFVSTAVTHLMSESGHQMLSSLGNAGVPAAVVSFGVQSYDSIMDYATGTIDGNQLAYDLAENAAEIGGGIAGSAFAGAVVGSVVPGAGTLVGFGAGMVGGMVGCAVASEAYASAVKVGAENVDVLSDKAKEMANHTIEIASEIVPDKVDSIIASINDYASVNNLPFRVG